MSEVFKAQLRECSKELDALIDRLMRVESDSSERADCVLYVVDKLADAKTALDLMVKIERLRECDS